MNNLMQVLYLTGWLNASMLGYWIDNPYDVLPVGTHGLLQMKGV